MGRRSKEWERLLESIDGVHSKRFNAALHTMDDETFALNFIKILEFTKPKLQRTDLTVDEEDTTINIIHSHSGSTFVEENKNKKNE